MGLNTVLNRLEYLDHLIRSKQTGTPKQFAEKLEISERWLYELLNELKYDLNCPLEYSKDKQSYLYSFPGCLVFGFQEIGTEAEEKKK